MVRALYVVLLSGSLAVLFGVGVTRAEDEKKADCTIALKGDNDVVKACKQGGIKRAKMVMKSMQKLAKQKGMKVECDSCHKNETDWALTAEGEGEFKKMIELVNKS